MISIITPAFNASKTILDTYQSILGQSYKDWEWIVVDDFSTDNTSEIISEISKKDKRVILLKNKQNLGAAHSRNAGISAAKGRYIAFIDSDDLWLSEKLSKQIDFMVTNNFSFTFSNYFILSKNNKQKEHRVKKDYLTYKDLLKRNAIGCSTVIYDTEVLGKQFMPVDSPKREDHAAWLDIVKLSKKAYRIDQFLTIYRIGIRSVSSNKIKMIKYQYLMYRNHEGFSFLKSLWYTFIVSLNKIFRVKNY